MLEELLEERLLVIVGRVGGKREELAKGLIARASAAGLSLAVLDYHGLFGDLQLRAQAPSLPYRAVSEHLPLVLSSIPGPSTPAAEVAAADAAARSRTMSECLARLASRADTAAFLAYRKLSLLLNYIVDSAQPLDARGARVELAAAPPSCRRALTLLWVAYLERAGAPPPELVVVGELSLATRERAWVEPLLEELTARGTRLVLLERSMQRWHLRHTVALAEITPETRAYMLAHRLPLPSESALERGAAVIDSSSRVREIKLHQR